MPKVFVHTRKAGQEQWENEEREFAQVPRVGEHFTTHTTSPWYQVEIVVHIAFEADFVAEVFAVEVDHLEVHRRSAARDHELPAAFKSARKPVSAEGFAQANEALRRPRHRP